MFVFIHIILQWCRVWCRRSHVRRVLKCFFALADDRHAFLAMHTRPTVCQDTRKQVYLYNYVLTTQFN